MSIVFSAAGMSNLTLERGRLYPLSMPIQINQELNLTDGMNPKITDYGGTAQFWKVIFNYLSKDNYDGSVNGLKTWFEDSNINWCENSFILTDENGVAHTVRLWQKGFDMPENSSGRYSVSLTLLEE